VEALKKIKILFLIGSYGTGGKERQLAELILGLDTNLFEIHLLIKTDGAHYLKQITGKLSSFHNLNRQRFGWKAILNIAKVVRETNPDIIHSWAETTSSYSILIKIFTPKKFILVDGSIRSAVKNTSIFYRLQRIFINRFSNFIISNSRAGLKVYEVPERKSCFIYNGYNFSRISNLINVEVLKKQLGISKPYLIGMVARIDFQKDWDTFFTACLNLLKKRNDISFIIVGDGSRRNYFETIISSKKNDFIFTGIVDNVESYINLFDIAILSSYYEGISNSIMEYMALKKPVIASGLGGVEEIVLNNETGLIFNIGDYAQLEHQMIELIENQALRKKISSAAFQNLERNFSNEKMIETYARIYKKLISTSN